MLSPLQESRDQRSSSVNQADIQSCFGDLADHIDDDPWPALDEHSSLIARSEVNDLSSQCSRTNPKINTPETCSKIQDTATGKLLNRIDIVRKSKICQGNLPLIGDNDLDFILLIC